MYQKVSPHITCKLDGYIITDDGYRPFSNSDFNIEWSANSVKIAYGIGEGNRQNSIVFEIR